MRRHIWSKDDPTVARTVPKRNDALGHRNVEDAALFLDRQRRVRTVRRDVEDPVPIGIGASVRAHLSDRRQAAEVCEIGRPWLHLSGIIACPSRTDNIGGGDRVISGWFRPSNSDAMVSRTSD